MSNPTIVSCTFVGFYNTTTTINTNNNNSKEFQIQTLVNEKRFSREYKYPESQSYKKVQVIQEIHESKLRQKIMIETW